jgi:hypothetical protein
MRHPLVGPLTVVQQTLSHGPGPNMVVATTEAGSPSRAALALLAQVVTQDTVPADPAQPTPRAEAG